MRQKPTRRKRRVCRRRAARQPTRGQLQPFAPTSFWNAPLADDAPLDAKSPRTSARLQELLKRWAPYVNTTRYSTPVYTVPAGQPTVRVSSTRRTRRDLQAAFERVPIPRRRAARGGHATATWSSGSRRPTRCGSSGARARLSDGWHARLRRPDHERLGEPGPLPRDHDGVRALPGASSVGRHRHEPAAARRPDADRRARGGPDRPRARDRAAGDPRRARTRGRRSGRTASRATRTRSRRARASGSTRRST